MYHVLITLPAINLHLQGIFTCLVCFARGYIYWYPAQVCRHRIRPMMKYAKINWLVVSSMLLNHTRGMIGVYHGVWYFVDGTLSTHFIHPLYFMLVVSFGVIHRDEDLSWCFHQRNRPWLLQICCINRGNILMLHYCPRKKIIHEWPMIVIIDLAWCISIYLSIYLSIHPSIYLSIYL